MDLTVILLLFIFSTGLSIGVEGEATVDHIDKNQAWGSSSLKARPLRSRLGLRLRLGLGVKVRVRVRLGLPINEYVTGRNK